MAGWRSVARSSGPPRPPARPYGPSRRSASWPGTWAWTWRAYGRPEPAGGPVSRIFGTRWRDVSAGRSDRVGPVVLERLERSAVVAVPVELDNSRFGHQVPLDELVGAPE